MTETIIDATNSILGRLGTNVAKRLLNGENIIIVNSEKAIIVGKKRSIVEDYKKKRELGTSRKGPFFPRMPDRIVKRCIRGMLPYQQPKGREALKRLKCYIGVPEELKDKKFEIVKEAIASNPVEYITIGELSKYLGATF
jgi:large subunit ribosomal protein L13